MMNEKDTLQKNKEVDGNQKKRKREEETQEKSKRSKVSESPSKQTFEKNKGKIYQKKDDESGKERGGLGEKKVKATIDLKELEPYGENSSKNQWAPEFSKRESRKIDRHFQWTEQESASATTARTTKQTTPQKKTNLPKKKESENLIERMPPFEEIEKEANLLLEQKKYIDSLKRYRFWIEKHIKLDYEKDDTYYFPLLDHAAHVCEQYAAQLQAEDKDFESNEYYYQAIRFYQEILEISPNDIEILHRMAKLYRQKSKTEMAIFCLEKGFKLPVSKENLHNWSAIAIELSAIYADVGDYEKSLMHAEESIKKTKQFKEPVHGADIFNKAEALFHLNRSDEAKKCFEDILKENQKDGESWFYRGKLYLLQKNNLDFNIPIAYYEQAIEHAKEEKIKYKACINLAKILLFSDLKNDKHETSKKLEALSSELLKIVEKKQQNEGRLQKIYYLLAEIQYKLNPSSSGCDLYLMPSFPDNNLESYKNSYILVGTKLRSGSSSSVNSSSSTTTTASITTTNTYTMAEPEILRLRYITFSGEYEKKDVLIGDMEKFLNDIKKFNLNFGKKLHLSDKQVNELITLNIGHTPSSSALIFFEKCFSIKKSFYLKFLNKEIDTKENYYTLLKKQAMKEMDQKNFEKSISFFNRIDSDLKEKSSDDAETHLAYGSVLVCSVKQVILTGVKLKPPEDVGKYKTTLNQSLVELKRAQQSGADSKEVNSFIGSAYFLLAKIEMLKELKIALYKQAINYLKKSDNVYYEILSLMELENFDEAQEKMNSSKKEMLLKIEVEEYNELKKDIERKKSFAQKRTDSPKKTLPPDSSDTLVLSSSSATHSFQLPQNTASSSSQDVSCINETSAWEQRKINLQSFCPASNGKGKISCPAIEKETATARKGIFKPKAEPTMQYDKKKWESIVPLKLILNCKQEISKLLNVVYEHCNFQDKQEVFKKIGEWGETKIFYDLFARYTQKFLRNAPSYQITKNTTEEKFHNIDVAAAYSATFRGIDKYNGYDLMSIELNDEQELKDFKKDYDKSTLKVKYQLKNKFILIFLKSEKKYYFIGDVFDNYVNDIPSLISLKNFLQHKNAKIHQNDKEEALKIICQGLKLSYQDTIREYQLIWLNGTMKNEDPVYSESYAPIDIKVVKSFFHESPDNSRTLIRKAEKNIEVKSTHKYAPTNAVFSNAEIRHLMKKQNPPQSTYQVYRLYGAGQVNFFVRKIKDIEISHKNNKQTEESAKNVKFKL